MWSRSSWTATAQRRTASTPIQAGRRPEFISSAALRDLPTPPRGHWRGGGGTPLLSLDTETNVSVNAKVNAKSTSRVDSPKVPAWQGAGTSMKASVAGSLTEQGRACVSLRLGSGPAFRVRARSCARREPARKCPVGTGGRRISVGNTHGSCRVDGHFRWSQPCRPRTVNPSRKLRRFESFTCHHVLKRLLTSGNAGEGPFRGFRL